MRKIAASLLAWGPGGVFLLAILDSAGIPLPAGVDALILAVAAVHGHLAYWSALAAIAGSAIGCMILFFIARKGGEMFLERHTLTPSARRFRNWFHEYGLLTIFIPALVPIIPLPLKVFVLSAGALGVRPLGFLAVVLLARIPRYIALAYLGSKLGENSWAYLKDHTWQFAGLAVGLFVFLALLIRFSSSFRKAVVKLEEQ